MFEDSTAQRSGGRHVPPWRCFWPSLAITLFGCGIEPIPSIAAPVDITVSSLAAPEGPVVIAGKPGSVPGGAVVTIADRGAGKMVDVTADDRGAFSARVSVSVGSTIELAARLGDAVSPHTTTLVRSASEAGVPPTPGAAPIIVSVPVDGTATVSGGVGSVTPAAELVIARFPAVTFTRADSTGSFSTDIRVLAGDDVAIVAVVASVASAARVIVTPATEDDIDHDGDGFAARDDCDDDDRKVFPGAAERSPLVDDDCDGETDEPGDDHGGSDGQDGSDSADSADSADSTDGTDATDAADGTDDSTDATDGTDAVDDGGGGGADDPPGTDS